RLDAEALLDDARRQLDHLLDALEELRRLVRVHEALVTLARDQVGGVALGEERQIGVQRPAISADADHAAALADQALGGGAGEQGDTVPQGDLGEMMVVDRPQDGVAVAEGDRVAVLHAEQAVAVGGEETALDQPAFPGQGLDAIRAEDVGVGEVLGEVDAAGPVLGAGERRGLDGGDAEAGAGQSDGGRQPGGARADDDDIESGGGHEIRPRPGNSRRGYSRTGTNHRVTEDTEKDTEEKESKTGLLTLPLSLWLP